MGFADAATDKTRWLMLPQQINAYYHPNLNEIVFPAAILQPPFFNPDADEAVNFGSFGAVVGHEMTHGVYARLQSLSCLGVMSLIDSYFAQCVIDSQFLT